MMMLTSVKRYVCLVVEVVTTLAHCIKVLLLQHWHSGPGLEAPFLPRCLDMHVSTARSG
jgi:hypothetical protein